MSKMSPFAEGKTRHLASAAKQDVTLSSTTAPNQAQLESNEPLVQKSHHDLTSWWQIISY
jgi:hypothetical protein